MKQIEEYTKDELVRLCKEYSVRMTIWWFRFYRMYRMKPEEKDEPIIMRKLDLEQSPRFPNKYYHILDINELEYKIGRLSENYGENYKKIRKLRFECEALRLIDKCLYWFWGGYDSGLPFLRDHYSRIPAEDMMFELHMCDDSRERVGMATELEALEFVWNTLQYLDIDQLGKLLKFTIQGEESRWDADSMSMDPGRRSKVCEIRQIDIETGAVVNTYQTRNELMQELGIKKSHLSQCIKTSKESPNDRDAWKKWVGKDDRKYGFKEAE